MVVEYRGVSVFGNGVTRVLIVVVVVGVVLSGRSQAAGVGR